MDDETTTSSAAAQWSKYALVVVDCQHDFWDGDVPVAGLVTSTCVLFTASSATQLGYLVAVVTDCCSDSTASTCRHVGQPSLRVRPGAV